MINAIQKMIDLKKQKKIYYTIHNNKHNVALFEYLSNLKEFFETFKEKYGEEELFKFQKEVGYLKKKRKSN